MLVGSKGVERNAHSLGIVPMLVSLKSKATNDFRLGTSVSNLVRRTGNGGSEPKLVIRCSNGFLQVILRVTACTGRTLGFLPKMVSKRYLPGYRWWCGLLKDEAETMRVWVSVSIMVSARMVTTARLEWVSRSGWLSSRINAPAIGVWVSYCRWLVQVCYAAFTCFSCSRIRSPNM